MALAAAIAEKQTNGSLVVTDGAARFSVANYDFNVRSFRSNVVLRWEYRPGSLLYLVWQQARRIRRAHREPDPGSGGADAGAGAVARRPIRQPRGPGRARQQLLRDQDVVLAAGAVERPPQRMS